MASNDITTAEVLMVSTSLSSSKNVLDSDCSYHMCPNLSAYISCNKIEGGQFF